MSQDRNKRAEDLFQSAADLEPARRAQFLDEACGDDMELRADVESLLEFLPDEDGDSLLDRPVARMGLPDRRVTDPERIGPFRVLRRLGEGAYGVVYEVEQTEPIRRRVALKLLKPGMDTEEVLDRFENERQTLAIVDHPNIARVIDAGASEQGRPFFVMELVAGDSITEYCDRVGLGLRERLELFITVCRAVQHAHQRGILHRDIKPSNVLVTLVDGRPVPKVIDFGIAKVMAGPSSGPQPMSSGPGLGTPIYMSPEQASTSRLDVDTATDVYSLGVLCYQLLTGGFPYPQEQLRDVPPDQYEVTLRRLTPAVPSDQLRSFPTKDASEVARKRGTSAAKLAAALNGDVDAIIMKAIAKDRLRRYPTVHDLVSELERYFRHEPVLAAPGSTMYRLSKFVKRHAVALGIATTIAAAVAIGGAAMTWSLVESNRQRAAAEVAQSESDAVLTFITDMLASVAPAAEGRDVTVKSALDAASREIEFQFNDQPLVEARLRLVIGRAYRELGELDTAREHIDRSERLYTTHLGESSLRVVDTVREKGVLERVGGDYARAEALFKQVLTERTEKLGASARESIISLKDLGDLYVMWDEGDPIPILEQALALSKESLGIDDDVTEEVSSSLGAAYLLNGQHDQAEPLLVAAIEANARRHGPTNAGTLQSMQNLASLYREQRRLSEAEPLYRRAYEGSVEVFGEDHPTTLRMMGNLGLLLSDMGQYDDAYTYSTRIVEIREATIGPDKPPTLVSRINLALLLMRMQRYDECVASARETRMRIGRSLGSEHLYAHVLSAILGRALHLGGNLTEGERTLRDAIAGSRDVLPEGHWRIGRQLVYWGECLTDMRRFEQAESALLEGHVVLESTYGGDHEQTQGAAKALADLYDRWGRAADRDTWAGRAGL